MIDKRILTLKCLLIKDFIHTQYDVQKMMEYTADVNIYKIGFTALMKYNEYTENQFIDCEGVFKDLPRSY